MHPPGYHGTDPSPARSLQSKPVGRACTGRGRSPAGGLFLHFCIFFAEKKRSLNGILPAPLAQGFRIMVAELGRLLGGEVLFLVHLQVFLHLLHDMFGFVEVPDIQVCRGPCNLLGMAALGAEFPFLETIHVRERAARGAPDDKVHINVVMRVVVINIYPRAAGRIRVREVTVRSRP